MTVKAVQMPNSTAYNKRYMLVDEDTGAVISDAQGYGYKTPQKAYASYHYQNAKKKRPNTRKVERWLKTQEDFADAMEKYCFEVEVKGSWGADVRFDDEFIARLLKDYELSPPFSAAELLKTWRKL